MQFSSNRRCQHPCNASVLSSGGNMLIGYGVFTVYKRPKQYKQILDICDYNKEKKT